MTSPLAARAEAWALELTARRSVNGTADEAAFAPWLRGRLAALPAFAGEPGRVWTIPVPGDPLGRASVAALVRGRGPRTVVLTGHFDTVWVDDYGDLAPLATRPHELRAALIGRLSGNGADPLALADLESGDFLPGRGLLDMKSGLAAGLAALEAFAAEPDRAGSLLFLAVPDEEANSAGARSAAPALAEIAERFGLSFEAAINLDAMVDGGDGASARRVALGTVGKLLPSAYVVGRAAHAAESLRGLNAAALMAGIVAAVELSPALTERTEGEVAAPPTLLGLKDGRQAYDVTTPEAVWAYWNVMTHRRGPAAVLAAFADLCREAVARSAASLAERARSLGETVTPVEPPVLTFADLCRGVLDGDRAAGERFACVARDLAGRGLDLPEQCRRLTEHLWRASGRSGPAVVIGLASLPYLPTELRGPGGARLAAAVEEATAALAKRTGVRVGTLRYFTGISDMSYLGQADAAAVPTIAANTPAWGHGIAWPSGNAIAGLATINAGPWGRDYHTPLERVHAPYAFGVLPELLREVVERLLSEPAP